MVFLSFHFGLFYICAGHLGVEGVQDDLHGIAPLRRFQAVEVFRIVIIGICELENINQTVKLIFVFKHKSLK